MVDVSDDGMALGSRHSFVRELPDHERSLDPVESPPAFLSKDCLPNPPELPFAFQIAPPCLPECSREADLALPPCWNKGELVGTEDEESFCSSFLSRDRVQEATMKDEDEKLEIEASNSFSRLEEDDSLAQLTIWAPPRDEDSCVPFSRELELNENVSLCASSPAVLTAPGWIGSPVVGFVEAVTSAPEQLCITPFGSPHARLKDRSVLRIRRYGRSRSLPEFRTSPVPRLRGTLRGSGYFSPGSTSQMTKQFEDTSSPAECDENISLQDGATFRGLSSPRTPPSTPANPTALGAIDSRWNRDKCNSVMTTLTAALGRNCAQARLHRKVRKGVRTPPRRRTPVANDV